MGTARATRGHARRARRDQPLILCVTGKDHGHAVMCLGHELVGPGCDDRAAQRVPYDLRRAVGAVRLHVPVGTRARRRLRSRREASRRVRAPATPAPQAGLAREDDERPVDGPSSTASASTSACVTGHVQLVGHSPSGMVTDRSRYSQYPSRSSAHSSRGSRTATVVYASATRQVSARFCSFRGTGARFRAFSRRICSRAGRGGAVRV
jgi:hypothetical protein